MAATDLVAYPPRRKALWVIRKKKIHRIHNGGFQRGTRDESSLSESYRGSEGQLDVMASMSIEVGRTVLSEEDIPGAALSGRNPFELKNSELVFWLKCRGDPAN